MSLLKGTLEVSFSSWDVVGMIRYWECATIRYLRTLITIPIATRNRRAKVETIFHIPKILCHFLELLPVSCTEVRFAILDYY
jgi:hypothetical protein